MNGERFRCFGKSHTLGAWGHSIEHSITMSEIVFGTDQLGPQPAIGLAEDTVRVQDRSRSGLTRSWLEEDLLVETLAPEDLKKHEGWNAPFAGHYKDHRYYTIIEDTLHPEFVYGYIAVKGQDGYVLAVQPYFVLDQDLLTGSSGNIKAWADAIRKYWPKFLFQRTLMLGSVAGEGHLHVREQHVPLRQMAGLIAEGALEAAKKEGAALVVFKEFKDRYRPFMGELKSLGFAKVPSLPMTKLAIDFKSFEEYFESKLGRSTRKDLRRKFKVTDKLNIELSVVHDISEQIDELYPLYLQVYNRSQMRFEKLSKDYFRELGRRMPDRTRFFVWRLDGKAIAFNLCMVSEDTLYDKYIGLDYVVAHDLHLYHYTFRDILSWAIDNRYKWYCSTALNYDPKFHWRMQLDPLDLYVRHRWDPVNFFMKHLLPLLEPTKNDKNLQRFSNFADLKQT
jgi:predicted N-acyltransferase